jgi:hypothetical protein
VANEHPYRRPPDPAPAPSRWRAWLRRDHWTRAICSQWQWYRRLAGGVWVRETHVPTTGCGWHPAEQAAQWTYPRSYHVVAVEWWPTPESGGPR